VNSSCISPPKACKVTELQSDIIASPATPPAVVDAPITVARSLTPPAVALVLQASAVVEFFEVKPPDLAALEVGSEGATLMWSRRSAQLAVKSRGGTKLPAPPRRRLPSKVVPRQRLACLRSCSVHLSCCFVAAASPDRIGVLGRAPRSAWCVKMEVPCGCARCCE
jgi:hypothetical protein